MRIIIGLLFFILIIGVGAFFLADRYLDTPLNISNDIIEYQVTPGTSLRSIANNLSEQRVMKYPAVFIWYGRWKQQADKIQVGEYKITAGTTPRQLLATLVKGEVTTYHITLVEGWHFKDILVELKQHAKLTKVLSGLNDEQIMKKIGHPGEHPEGRFFPDTYHYRFGDSDRDILLRSYQRMQTVLAQEWEARKEGLPYNSAYQALVMASIVEKETGVAFERGRIAGVFVRRLQKKMRLQSDPTIIYGLADRYNGNITRAHLQQKTAYNTYMIDGLPPTPIAIVGREAIHAALNPAPGKSLYFVAKGDGSHYFSNTLQEHNAAVKQYQIMRRNKNYRSTPN